MGGSVKRYDLKTWEVLLKPAKKLKIGQKIVFSEGLLEAELIEIKEDGNLNLREILKKYWINWGRCRYHLI